jgi:hypothetical protein
MCCQLVNSSCFGGTWCLHAILGVLYGPLIPHLLLALADCTFMIEPNVAINLQPPVQGSSWNLNPSIIEGLRVVQEESVHSSWTTLKMETGNASETLGTIYHSTGH